MSNPKVAIDINARDNASLALQGAQDRLARLRSEIDMLRGKSQISALDVKNINALTREAGALERGLNGVGKAGVQAAGDLRNAFGQLDGVLSGIGLGGLGGLLTAGGLVAAGVAAGKVAVELGNLGAQALVTEKSFNSVMRSIGSTPALLDKLNAAAGGTIDDMRLMQLANTALAGSSQEMGAAFAAALPSLIEGARAANQLNPALGDTEFLFQSLVTGIKRGSPMLIDNTGITLKLGEANELYAAKLGKTAAALTEEEKKLALLQATMEGADRLVQQAGGNLDNLTTSAQTLSAAWANLKTEFGKTLAPEVSGGQSFLTQMLNTLTDNMRAYSEEQALFELAQRNADGTTRRLADAQAALTDAVQRGDDASAAYYADLVNGYTVLHEAAQAELSAAAATLYHGQIMDAAAGAAAGLAGAYRDLAANLATMPELSPSVTAINWGNMSKDAIAQAEGGFGNTLAFQYQTANNKAPEAFYKAQEQANTAAARDWQTKMEAAGKAVATRIQGYLTEGSNFSIGLNDMRAGGGKGANAPGAGGAFEDIFRLQAWLNDSSWGDVGQRLAGGNKEKARQIVQDFQNGIFSPEVIGAIDVDQLANQAAMQDLAGKSQEAFAKAIAGKAGVADSVVKNLLGVNPNAKGDKPADTAAADAMNALAGSVGTVVKGKDFAGQIMGYGETIFGYVESGMVNKAKTSGALQSAIDAMVAGAFASYGNNGVGGAAGAAGASGL